MRHRHDHRLGLDYQSVDELKAALDSLPTPARLTQVYRCHHGQPVSLRSWRSWRRLSWRSMATVALVGDLAIAALAVGLPRAVGLAPGAHAAAPTADNLGRAAAGGCRRISSPARRDGLGGVRCVLHAGGLDQVAAGAAIEIGSGSCSPARAAVGPPIGTSTSSCLLLLCLSSSRFILAIHVDFLLGRLLGAGERLVELLFKARLPITSSVACPASMRSPSPLGVVS